MGQSTESSPVFAYPVALDVRGRRCVVVGAGAVGARRALALADAGADVALIAPQAGAEAQALISTGRVTHYPTVFTPDLLEDTFLAVAATDDPAVNAQVARAARERRLLVNLAAPGEETGEGGDFATMAAVRRGDLILAVTAGGAGPALAGRLRRDLEAVYGPEWAGYVALLGEMRSRAKEHIAEPQQRAGALRRLAASDTVREQALAGDLDSARQEALACLS